jgi:hypothetical protein
MPLSTSSSEVQTESSIRWRHNVMLLAVVLAIALAFELGTRFGVTRLSKVSSRVQAEYKQALAIRKGEKTKVLFLGNSLLDAALDMPRVQKAFAPRREVKRLIIEQTNYTDWYYGMRRLFNEGARPDVVVLCLTATNLMLPGVRGEYFAYYMMEPGDLPSVAAELDLHPTEALNMLSANISSFYGMRSEIRKVFMGRLMPFTRPLMALITRTNPRIFTDDEVRNVVPARLQRLKETASRYGAEFVLLMPPVLGTGRSDIVAEAGAAVNVPVVAVPRLLQAGQFTDGYHASAEGAAIYTERIIPLLNDVLTNAESARTAGKSQP